MKLLIAGYDHANNVLTAEHQGSSVTVDPFVSCAFELSEVEYENCKAAELIGRTFYATCYRVCNNHVVLVYEWDEV